MTPIQSDHPSTISQTLGLTGSPARGKRLKRLLAWSVPALVIIAVIARSLAGNGTDPLQYKTQPAVRGGLSVSVTATGNLKPTNQVEVGSELSGTVRYVDVDYNDKVKLGQVLARLDMSKLEAQAQQSKASLESAQARVLQAKATVREAKSALERLEHVRAISNNKAVSQQDMDTAEAALARALADETYSKAEVLRTRAVLEATETDLAKALIRSPINGIVLARSVEPGQTVASSFQAPVLFILAEDLTKMELHVSVDEADVGEVHEGQEATFTVDAYPDRRFPAHIAKVRYGAEGMDEETSSSGSSSNSSGVVTYIAVLELDNSDLSLRPGMTATAEITVKRIEEALLVPNAALRFTPPETEKKSDSTGGGIMSKIMPRPPRPTSRRAEAQKRAGKETRVWTLRDGQPVAIPVTTGATDGTLTVIKEGAVEPDMPLVVDAVSVKQ